MKAIARALPLLIAVGASVAVAKPAGTKPHSAQPDLLHPVYTLNTLVDVLALTHRTALFTGPVVYCNTTTPCTTAATVTPLYDSQQKLVSCVVQTSDIKMDFGTKPKLGDQVTITWNLVVPATSTETYKFQDPGLLIIKDDYASTSGKGDVKSDTQLTLVDKWKRHNVQIVHFPIVTQTLTDGSFSLCGARDPVIANS